MATLKADFVQGIIMMFGVTALAGHGCHLRPRWAACRTASPHMICLHGEQNQMAPHGFPNLVSLVATILMTSFGTWGLPQMVHKYYGIRDDKEVKRGAIISTFFALLVAGGGYFIGSFSHLFFGSELPGGAERTTSCRSMLNMAGSAQYPDRYCAGAADFRVCVHTFQHHPDRLLHRNHGFGEGEAEAQYEGQNPGQADPYFLLDFRRGLLCQWLTIPLLSWK